MSKQSIVQYPSQLPIAVPFDAKHIAKEADPLHHTDIH